MAKPSNLRSWLIVDPLPAHDLDRLREADGIVVDLDRGDSCHAVSDFCSAMRAALPGKPLAFLLPALTDRQDAALTVALQEGCDRVFAVVEGAAAVQRLDMLLRLSEARLARSAGATGIVALANAKGILAASGFVQCSKRLRALGWMLDCDGQSTTAGLARATMAVAAHAAGLDGIDAASPHTDAATFRDECRAARRAGLSGKLCRFPEQVAIVNDVFGDQPPATRSP